MRKQQIAESDEEQRVRRERRAAIAAALRETHASGGSATATRIAVAIHRRIDGTTATIEED